VTRRRALYQGRLRAQWPLTDYKRARAGGRRNGNRGDAGDAQFGCTALSYRRPTHTTCMRQELNQLASMPNDRKVPELTNLDQLPFKVRQSTEFAVSVPPPSPSD